MYRGAESAVLRGGISVRREETNVRVDNADETHVHKFGRPFRIFHGTDRPVGRAERQPIRRASHDDIILIWLRHARTHARTFFFFTCTHARTAVYAGYIG